MRSTYKIGDSRELLKELEPSSVDLIVTDPPYGYSFMGKDWDRAVPSVDIWRECLRVLKPGAFSFIMSAPRLDVQSEMARRIQEAGFDISFTPLFWAYATGFPKAMNIGKAVDKKFGAERGVIGQGRHNRESWRNSEARPDIPEPIFDITAPATPQAKALDGAYAGFQPKPAVEVIIVAMKPLSEKTYVDQALANGKGVTWLDSGRIPFESEDDAWEAKTLGPRSDNGTFNNATCGLHGNVDTSPHQGGRFPANLLVSDDVLDDGTIHTSGFAVVGTGNDKANTIYGQYAHKRITSCYADSGGFSRYFSLDKWAEQLPFLIVPKASKGEKNKGAERLPQTFKCGAYGDGFGAVPKVNGERPNAVRNHHPTVKPLKLMSYLITLGSRPGDVVLDPFAGSGTTLLAARLLNRSSIGFELSPEYAEILKARTGWLPPALESFEGGRA